MTEYRIYVVDKNNHILGPADVVDAVDDDAAMKKAAALLDGHAIEIWQLSRFVVRLEPGKPPNARSLLVRGMTPRD